MTDALDGIRAHFQARGKKDFKLGRPRHAHGMMRGTAALFDYLIGYDLAKTQHDTADKARVELAQEG